MTHRIASCSCGQLTVETRADPVRVSMCHCTACQRRTGSVFGAQARFRRDACELRGTSTIYVRTGEEGGKIAFHFCPTCGSTVHYVFEGDDEDIAIPVGAFGDATFPAPTFSVYEDRKHPWVVMPAGVEHLA